MCLCYVDITLLTSSIASNEKGSWKCTCQRPIHSERCDLLAGHLEPGGLEESRGCQKTTGSSGAHAKDADRTGSNLLGNAVAKPKSDAIQGMIEVIDLTGNTH